jgi:hypothetical protein
VPRQIGQHRWFNQAGLLLQGVSALFFAFDTVRYFRLMPTIAITTLKIAQSAITVFVSIGDTPFRRRHPKQRSTMSREYTPHPIYCFFLCQSAKYLLLLGSVSSQQQCV